MIRVFHVVTERPMQKGQVIVFDQSNHNGVYNRVMTFRRLADGEPPEGGLAQMIYADMEKWSKVAYRELALERVRAEQYCEYPSRMACLYTSRTRAEAEQWARFFCEIGRKVYGIAVLSVEGRVYDGNANLCFDGTGDCSDIEKAHIYWENSQPDENPVIETLVDGVITVEEIIDAEAIL